MRGYSVALSTCWSWSAMVRVGLPGARTQSANGQSRHGRSRGGQRGPADRELQVPTGRARPTGEGTARRLVAGYGVVQVDRRVVMTRAVVHLVLPRHACRQVVRQTRHQALRPDRLDRRPTDEKLAVPLVGRPVDCFRAHLRLED